jgi:hypothetical protein
MTRITADASLLAKLDNLTGVIQVCDDSGHTLGYFHPAIPLAAASGRPTTSPVSDEEIEQCRQQRTGRPLSEIMAEFESQP